MAYPQRIHTLGTPFDFDKITLTTPTVVQGGAAHFTKLLHGDEALYVQTPTCETRQGMVINGRKAYYDVILDPNANSSQIAAENAAFLEWVECLEDRIICSLHEHGKLWFRDPLSEDDIRNLFASSVKPFKGGKQFSMRINVLPGKARTNQFNCTVFDESENSVQVEYINATHNIISIVEVLGIRFTSSSFQLELASKQIAIILLKPVFQTCIIKKDIGFSGATSNNAKQLAPNPDKHTVYTPPTAAAVAADTTTPMPAVDIRSVDDIQVDNDASSIKIKDPLEVYYALYKAARKRAREAKQLSIAAYLDAKNIKNTYNLQLVDGDSSDDSDSNDDDDDDDDHDDDSEDEDSEKNRNDGDGSSDSGDNNDSDSDSDSNKDDDGDDLKKRPPINISGDSIDLIISDYDSLG